KNGAGLNSRAVFRLRAGPAAIRNDNGSWFPLNFRSHRKLISGCMIMSRYTGFLPLSLSLADAGYAQRWREMIAYDKKPPKMPGGTCSSISSRDWHQPGAKAAWRWAVGVDACLA